MYYCWQYLPSHGIDWADQVVSLIVEDLEYPRVGEDPNNSYSWVYHPNPGQMVEPFPPAPFQMETRYKFISWQKFVNWLDIEGLRMEIQYSYFCNVLSVRVEFERDDVESKSMMNKITRHLRRGILRPSVVRKAVLLFLCWDGYENFQKRCQQSTKNI